MSVTIDGSVRFGASKLSIKEYGGETFTELEVDQSEDGVEFNFSGETKEIKSAQHTGPYKRLLVGESASVKIGILERNMDAIAYAFAHKPADLVDDEVSDPNTKSLEFGGPRDLIELSIQIESLQPVDPTLKDTMTLYRCTAKPEYSEVYKLGQERVIPVTFEALADIAGTEGTAGTLGIILSEVAAPEA